ncbi:uncharacterized protein LOC144506244 [Mustelus asterias]
MRGALRREMSLKCGFCKQTKEEVFCGELLHSQDRQLIVHRKCLLFSSVPKESKRFKNERLCGSSLPAIKRKLQKFTKMKCSHCHRTGASVKCAERCCRKVYHYPCVRSDNGVISENEIHKAYRVWCWRHKTESEDSSVGSTEGIQDTAQAKENDSEPQRKQCTYSLRKESRVRLVESHGQTDKSSSRGTITEYAMCNQTEADIECEVKGSMTTYGLHYAAPDSVNFVKNIGNGVDRLHCKNHKSNEEDGNTKKAHGLPSVGCCRSSSDEDTSSNITEGNFNEKISDRTKDDGRFRKCQKHPSYLLDDGTLKDSSVPKAAFQDLGSFMHRIYSTKTEKAKSFWTRVQAIGSVNHVFEQINDVLNCLKQKIIDGSANDQEYLKALILLNKAEIQDSSLSFDTTENEERFQHDNEQENSEKLVISEEMEAHSISDSSLFKQTSVIKSLPSPTTYPSPMERLGHPSLPEQLTFQQHQCSGLCIAKVTPPTPDHFKGENPLKIPILCQFQRRHGKLHWDTEVLELPHVSYKAPCGRGLRNFKEVHDYIFETQCDFLLLDFFSFNTYVQLSRTVSCKNAVIYEADISHGIEPVPIPLYNAVDVSKPQYFKYRKARLPHGYLISNSAEVFLQQCNCTDGCSDKSRCACQQLTTSVNKRFKRASGYEYKRLLQCAPSGLYECNKWCKCNERMCENRVVQHGLKTRLQLFKTKKRGWGVRCMDDVDKGTFMCCYAGRVLNLVNGVENQRHDKTVNCDVGVGSSKMVKPSIKVERKGPCLDSDIELIDAMEEAKTDVKGEEATPFTKMSPLIQEGSTKLSGREKPEDGTSCLHDSEMSAIKRPKTKTAVLQARRRRLQEQGQISIVHSSSEEDDSDSSGQRPIKLTRTFLPFSLKQHQTPSDNQPINNDKGVLEKRSSASNGRSCSISLGEKNFESPVFSKQETNEHETSNKKANEQDRLIQDNHYKKLTSKVQRKCNGDKRGECYFLDATEEGNIGRFINHSCDPNLMVQSVFVDTHDKNFPWVAFFTNRYIKAGSELTWDYKYSTGSTPEEEIPCLCGSANCRDRLILLQGKQFVAGPPGPMSAVKELGECAEERACKLCGQSKRSKKAGDLLFDGKIAVHHKCLLFSSNLTTRNSNSKGFDSFGGFLVKDIEQEVKRGRMLRCSKCRKRGATVGCEVGSCRRSYHYPCAIDDDAIPLKNKARGIYRVYCKVHSNQMENSPPSEQSNSNDVGSDTDDDDVANREENNLPEDSHPRRSWAEAPSSSKCTPRTKRNRVISSDTDESDELPIFLYNTQNTDESQTGSKQRKLENDDQTQNQEEFSNPNSEHFAENRTNSSNAEWSPSLFSERTHQDGQIQAQLVAVHWSIVEPVSTKNSHPDPPPISDENEPNDGNCSDTSTNVDQQEGEIKEVEVQEEPEDIQQEVQMQTAVEAVTTCREPHEPSTTGRAKAFWKKCKEAQCVEKIFMKIQNNLNSIQQNIVNEKATEKDYDTARAILLTVDPFQDFWSEFQSEIHQNLQHLEEEKISLQRREFLVEEMRKLAGSLNQKSHKEK